jgi:hypothetical protein
VRSLLIPVIFDDDGLRSDVVAGEMPVVSAERPVGVIDLAEVVGDTTVEADLVARVTAQVAAEVAEALVVLLEYNDLGFDFTTLLEDNSCGNVKRGKECTKTVFLPLGHLLQHSETLLDNLDANRVADFLALYHGLATSEAVEIIDTVKAVEAVETLDTLPFIERDVTVVTA